MILESTIGAIVGGAFRLVPEFLKTLDRKNERGHELKMLDAEMRFASLRAEQEMRKIDAAMTISEMDAITKAVTEQGQTARAAGSFVAAISALVRPLVTYAFVSMYLTVKIVGINMAIDLGGRWEQVLINAWTEEDAALLSSVLMFWFVSRSLNPQNGK
jgi:hypothetical protein